MFRITQGKGFMLTFENGWTVSVQFGTGNYCDRQDFCSPYEPEKLHNIWESNSAEIAAGDANKKWYSFGSDTVKGYVPADEVAQFINKVQKFK